MKEEIFQELLESIREAGAILREEKEPSRVFELEELDIKEIRKRYNMSREKFAGMLGVSKRTLEGWEQGRRKPKGPARRLLQVAARHPEAVLDAVHHS
jgi:putative transcriptional regulator